MWLKPGNYLGCNRLACHNTGRAFSWIMCIIINQPNSVFLPHHLVPSVDPFITHNCICCYSQVYTYKVCNCSSCQCIFHIMLSDNIQLKGNMVDGKTY